jgi:C-terminal processing protease CtpA/Prc
VSFYELVGRLQMGQKIVVTLYRAGTKIEKKITVKSKKVFAIQASYPGHDVIDYVIVSGLVIMQMTENHLALFMQDRPELGKFWQLQDRLQPAVLISYVVPGSYTSQLEILSAGDVVTHINGIEVTNMAMAHKALAIKKEYLTIHTDLYLELVIPKDQIKIEKGSYPLKISN